MTELLSLPGNHISWLALTCLVAGIVRGFSGFALSAIVMAIAVLFLKPIELIPILWMQELAASLLMVRGGWQDANKRVSLGLALSSAMGLPIGLWMTQSLPEDVSKLAALTVIVGLALLQLARIRMPFLATRPGLIGSGILSGMVSGVAHVGGMVVALYVLALNAPARQMRASLVLYLFTSLAFSLVTQTLMGVMTGQAFLRGLAMAPASLIGVWIGTHLFRPELEKYYKPFCLVLLIALALAAMGRVALA